MKAIVYQVIYSGENFTNEEYLGFDLSEAYSQYEDIESNSDYESRFIFSKEIDVEDFFTPDEDGEFDLRDISWHDLNKVSFGFDDDDIIEAGGFENKDRINQEKINIVMDILSKMIKTKVSKYFKYNETLYRIADHRHNSGKDHNFEKSFLITKNDKTASKFLQSSKTIEIDAELSEEEIATIIFETIN